MKQQVNLYLPEFRVKRDPLTAVRMAQLLGLVVVALTVSGLWNTWRNARLASQLEGLRQELAVETQRNQEIDQVLARQSQNPELAARLDQAERTLLASRQMREVLGQSGLGNADGFSESFKDLARASMDGLWLTEIDISQGGEAIVLKGFATDSALVPMYVARLGEGRSPLLQRQFSVVTTRVETVDPLYSFELRDNR